MATFPRSMSACVRECFARMGVMDPELRGRLADWLAYHLSNFEFMWPWDKWKYVLTAPAHDSRRQGLSHLQLLGSCAMKRASTGGRLT